MNESMIEYPLSCVRISGEGDVVTDEVRLHVRQSMMETSLSLSLQDIKLPTSLITLTYYVP